MCQLQRHVIALLYRYELAIVVVVICGGDDHVARLGPRRYAGADGDHAGALEMEIKGARKGLYHITLFMHVMFILLCILFLFMRDSSIIR